MVRARAQRPMACGVLDGACRLVARFHKTHCLLVIQSVGGKRAPGRNAFDEVLHRYCEAFLVFTFWAARGVMDRPLDAARFA